MSKFINDAIIGNKTVTASFSEKGELLRLFYPNIDYKQFIEKLDVGVKVNNSEIIYLHDDVNNIYNQHYIENTNILQTKILNTYFNLKIVQTDFVPMDENILVKKYFFKNESNIDLDVSLLLHSQALTNINNDTCGYVKNNTLIQYNHDYSVCFFSNENLLSYQVNGVNFNIKSGVIGGKDYIGLSSDSAISYKIPFLKPNEMAEISIYILINDNSKKSVLNKLDKEIERIKKLNANELLKNCENYWNEFIKKHDKLELEKSKINDKIKQIYFRSILLFPLLQNQETGGISAGMETDEYKEKSGRYSYCWTRDAVFITKGLDIIGMFEETSKFYNVFCKNTQSENGMWEQRFYTDGRLASSWGYQIDETASVIIGIYEHYLKLQDKEFLKNNLEMCEKAIEYLQNYMNNVFEEKEMQPSYDLWEMHEGISIYSISAIYAAIKSMVKIDNEVKFLFENNKLEEIEIRDKILENLSKKIKEYSYKKFYDEEKKIYIRNTDDKKIDISILGAITPFEMFDAKDERTKNTIQKINQTLRTYTGGYLRFEDDNYMGGQNPWPIANLWMALYYLEIGEKGKAKECFDFVVETATKHGFLGEQVDNVKMQANWIIGLAWSHSMFLIVLEKLKGDLL